MQMRLLLRPLRTLRENTKSTKAGTLSSSEVCPTCGNPADMFILYDLAGDTPSVGFGCTRCQKVSAKRPLNLSPHYKRALVESLGVVMLGVSAKRAPN